MRSGTNTFAKEGYRQPSVISISTEFSVTKFVLYLSRKNRCLYNLPDCRGLTRATYILCIEHLRMLRLSRESNPRPPALQANTICKEPFERHFSCYSESQLVLLQLPPKSRWGIMAECDSDAFSERVEIRMHVAT